MSINRRVFAWTLALACATGAVLALIESDTPLRLVLTPLFLLVAPGAAVMGLLRDRDPLAGLSVGVMASLVVNVLLATAMLSFDAWSPRAGVATVAVLSGFVYVLRVLYRGSGTMQAEQGTGSR
ncbi:hypothetical protein GCM10010156_42180 [Planobispora rosea]|uniref:Uncharacterized protein n=1 Tax=Planobispora rosea TaxID=35762 RepID=A0A8J3WEC9_PLARO|nr:hypothetical protein GCM10010156_42180 [Planobispora rosea]GIH85742.1 hypothetical protein Pro02_41500 [Planobispora rosea]